MEEQTRVTEHISAKGAREAFPTPRTQAEPCGIGETGSYSCGIGEARKGWVGWTTPHHLPARETHPLSHSMPTGRQQGGQEQWREGSI